MLAGFRDAAQIQATITNLGDPLHAEKITQIRALLHPHKSAA